MQNGAYTILVGQEAWRVGTVLEAGVDPFRHDGSCDTLENSFKF